MHSHIIIKSYYTVRLALPVAHCGTRRAMGPEEELLYRLCV